MVLAPTIDLDVIAHNTQGYSGADLQAIMYNAHLDVVQSSLSVSNGQALSAHGEAAHAQGKAKGKGKAKANGDVPHKPTIKPRRLWKQVAPSEQVDDPEAVRRVSICILMWVLAERDPARRPHGRLGDGPERTRRLPDG